MMNRKYTLLNVASGDRTNLETHGSFGEKGYHPGGKRNRRDRGRDGPADPESATSNRQLSAWESGARAGGSRGSF